MFRQKFKMDPTRLQWYGQSIDQDNLQLLKQQLEEKKQVSSIDIRFCGFSCGVSFLALLAEYPLRTVSFSYLQLNPAMIAAIAGFIKKNSHLEKIELNSCEITTSGARQILMATVNQPRLVAVNLQFNQIDNQILEIFSGMKKKVFFLKEIDLKQNKLTSEELLQVDALLKKTRMESQNECRAKLGMHLGVLPDLQNITGDYLGLDSTVVRRRP